MKASSSGGGDCLLSRLASLELRTAQASARLGEAAARTSAAQEMIREFQSAYNRRRMEIAALCKEAARLPLSGGGGAEDK